jgi:hypothetical protein
MHRAAWPEAASAKQKDARVPKLGGESAERVKSLREIGLVLNKWSTAFSVQESLIDFAGRRARCWLLSRGLGHTKKQHTPLAAPIDFLSAAPAQSGKHTPVLPSRTRPLDTFPRARAAPKRQLEVGSALFSPVANFIDKNICSIAHAPSTHALRYHSFFRLSAEKLYA